MNKNVLALGKINNIVNYIAKITYSYIYDI